MKSFFFTTLLLAITCVPSHAQFNFPAPQSATGSNRYPRYPAQTSSFAPSYPNSIDAGFSSIRYPVTQSVSPGSPSAGLGNAGFGVSGSYPQSAGTGISPASSTNGNLNTRTIGLFGNLLGGSSGGGGLFSNLLGGGSGRGGLFGNLLGALTGGSRSPGDVDNGNSGGSGPSNSAQPYPVPAYYTGYSPYGIPSPYAGGFGYPGYGGGFYG